MQTISIPISVSEPESVQELFARWRLYEAAATTACYEEADDKASELSREGWGCVQAMMTTQAELPGEIGQKLEVLSSLLEDQGVSHWRMNVASVQSDIQNRLTGWVPPARALRQADKLREGCIGADAAAEALFVAANELPRDNPGDLGSAIDALLRKVSRLRPHVVNLWSAFARSRQTRNPPSRRIGAGSTHQHDRPLATRSHAARP